MEIKEVRLKEELNSIKEFLSKNDLNYENSIDKTLYILDDDNIIASISKEKNVIKCLAVDEKYRSDNIASTIVSQMINFMYQDGIYHIMVYTKKIYELLFTSLNFKKIISTDKTVILEQGTPDINTVLSQIRHQVESQFNINVMDEKINAIVLNASPFTNGHLYLVEEARKTCDYLIVFLLEEDKSFYTFKERLALAYLATQCFGNVIVIPSTCYIISNLTFPTYFIKEENTKNHEWMLTDALIFNEYFKKALNIKYRYVGTESDPVMKLYNETLKEVLKDNLIEIDRLDSISASKVRSKVKDGMIDDALIYIPEAIKQMMRMISREKTSHE